jgi:hypothetical protein
MRYILALCLLATFIGCKDKTLTREQKESVLIEEFEATKNIIVQSKYMTSERTNAWIQEFTTKFNMKTEDVEKNGFKLNIINAKAMQLGVNNTISIMSTWELVLIKDTTDASGKVERSQLPSRRSVIYLWDPAASSLQPVLDSGFVAVQTK